MAAAIELRADFVADDLRRLAKVDPDAQQTLRLLALAKLRCGLVASPLRSCGTECCGSTSNAL